MMTNGIPTRVAIVTGGAQGIGRAVANEFARRRLCVVINDINAGQAEQAAAELRTAGSDAIAVAGSVCDKSCMQRLAAEAVQRWGRIDILANCAGVLRPTRLAEIPEEEWDFVVDVNLKGTFLASQAVLPAMTAGRWGRIVNISSTAGKSVSTIGGAHYTAAKAGVLGLTRHLSREVARHGITVNAVCPGLIDTEMVRATIAVEAVQRYAASFPIARLGDAEEVASLVAFLASDEAAYITGASVDINGGDLTI
jgi:Dehydrogenases with different specificities (related to short-chain alcohol dehydrogenases)